MTTRRVRIFFFAFAVAAICGSGVPAGAQQFLPTGRDTLRGLPGVEVMVEPLEGPVAEGGLNAREVRANVVRQLEAGGVTVYASQSENPSTAKPYVYVQLLGVAVDGQTYAVELQVHLRQTLRSPVTGSSIVNAMTWDQHTVLATPGGRIDDVRDALAEAVDTFVSDWRAMH